MTIRSRHGVTLVELLIAITIAVGVGTAILSLLLGFSRFQERTESRRSARQVGMGAINIIVNDLRMVDPSWGIEAVSSSSITVKVPYAMGMVCASTTTVQTIALLPVDSVVYSLAGYSGFATRASDGSYSTVSGGTVASVSWPASCTSVGDTIKQITAPTGAPNQKSLPITITLSTAMGSALQRGTIVMLYRRTRYYFGTSGLADLSGRTALWRDFLDDGAGATEVVSPFDATVAFKFYVSGSSASTTTVPGTLSSLRGFELFLPGESDKTARTQSGPEQANLTTSVFFVNTLTP